MTKPSVDARIGLRGLALAVTLGAGSLSLAAQQRPTAPQFRAGTDIVQLDVTVIDKKTRMPVRGLTAADFTVLEKDTPQEIVAFSAIDVPDRDLAAASWTREIGADVATNNLDAQRLVIIVLDDFALRYHPRVYEGVKKVAYAAIDQLGPEDVATVVYLFNRRKGQEFTTDHARLRAAVDRYESNALFMGGGACMFNSCHMQALQNIARSVLDLPARRKAVIFITDPYRPPPYDFRKQELENHLLPSDIRETFDLLRRGNVNVYIFPANAQFNKLPRVDEATYLKSALFAAATGGWLATTTSVEEAWTAIERVYRENSSYYILGFASSAREPDGQFHNVTVKVNRPDVEVNARTGYFALKSKPAKPPRGEPPTPLDETIMGAVPARDFPMSVTAVPVGRTSDKELPVAIIAGVDGDVDLDGTVEMVATVFRDDWKQQGAVTQKIDLGIGLPGPAGHWDFASRLSLKPGRYEVRVGLTHAASGRSASAYTSLTVPDVSKVPLSLSGILIERRSPPSESARPLADLVPVVPTTVRAFRTTDEVVEFVRVNQGGGKPALPVAMTISVADADDHQVDSRTLTVDASRFGRDRTADIEQDLPVSSLAPGAYLLTIEASAGTFTSRRDVRFKVVE